MKSKLAPGKQKILFIIQALRGGGVERVLLVLLRHLDRSLFEPILLVFETKDEYPGELPQDVRIVALDTVDKKGAIGNLRLIQAIASSIRREDPHIICSFMEATNHFTGVAKRIARSDAFLVFTYHSYLSLYYRPRRLRSRALVKWILKNIIYPKADHIISVSRGVMHDLIENWCLPKAKASVIYNPIELNRIRTLVHAGVDDTWFSEEVPVVIACGRLVPEKNYPLLLRAFARVLKEVPCRLAILGQGPERNKLEAYAKELGVADQVRFYGFQMNPFKFIARSTMLVLSSDFEGFGNVLVEAMACGTPVISIDCPSGPGEIIRDGDNGLLVRMGDDEGLASAIVRLIENQVLRQRLIAEGHSRARDFDVLTIIKQYEARFLSCNKDIETGKHDEARSARQYSY